MIFYLAIRAFDNMNFFGAVKSFVTKKQQAEKIGGDNDCQENTNTYDQLPFRTIAPLSTGKWLNYLFLFDKFANCPNTPTNTAHRQHKACINSKEDVLS